MTAGDLVLDLDLSRVVLHLRASGLSDAQIAELAGYRSHNSIWAIANGRSRPRIDDERVLALLDLHLERCPERHRREVLAHG